MTPDDTPSVIRILDRLEILVDRVSSLAERVATMEATVRGQAEHHAHFWEKDWPEVIARIQRVEGRLHNYQERIVKAEGTVPTIAAEAGALAERVTKLEKQAPRSNAAVNAPIVGGAIGGIAGLVEVLRLMGVL